MLSTSNEGACSRHVDNSAPYRQAIACLKQGHLIAYPTEAVFGIGCDPFQQQAIEKLARFKRRASQKGFILVASRWSQIAGLLKSVPEDKMRQVRETWPGHHTWIFPARNGVPSWLIGPQHTIAVRLSAHPVVRDLCDAFGGPITSTSANHAGGQPFTDYESVQAHLGHHFQHVVWGRVGDAAKPSTIQDVLTGAVLRHG